MGALSRDKFVTDLRGLFAQFSAIVGSAEDPSGDGLKDLKVHVMARPGEGGEVASRNGP